VELVFEGLALFCAGQGSSLSVFSVLHGSAEKKVSLMLGAWRRSEQGSGGVIFSGASSFVHIVEVSAVDESGDVVAVAAVDEVICNKNKGDQF
jgi:hypothetical protein